MLNSFLKLEPYTDDLKDKYRKIKIKENRENFLDNLLDMRQASFKAILP